MKNKKAKIHKLTLRIDEKLWRDVAASAKHNKRSINGEICYLCSVVAPYRP